jgi:hypothetical protein
MAAVPPSRGRIYQGTKSCAILSALRAGPTPPSTHLLQQAQLQSKHVLSEFPQAEHRQFCAGGADLDDGGAFGAVRRPHMTEHRQASEKGDGRAGESLKSCTPGVKPKGKRGRVLRVRVFSARMRPGGLSGPGRAAPHSPEARRRSLVGGPLRTATGTIEIGEGHA